MKAYIESFMRPAVMTVTQLLLVAHLLTTGQSHAAQPESVALGDVEVHHVRLKGYNHPPESHPPRLRNRHAVCAASLKLKGRQPTPLPSELPPILETVVIDVYYSVNRTLRDTYGELYEIRWDTCELYKNIYKTRHLHSGSSGCRMDLIKKKAEGQCDAAVHRKAPAARLLPNLPQPVAGVNKRVKGISCQLYRSSTGEKCIAHPKSNFPIPRAPINGGMPGLLLKEDDLVTLEAEKVDLHIRVPEDLFSVPPNLKITPFPEPEE